MMMMMMMDMMIHDDDDDDDVKMIPEVSTSKGQIVHERWSTQLTHKMMMMDMMMKYVSSLLSCHADG